MDDFGPHEFDARFDYPRWVDTQEVRGLLSNITKPISVLADVTHEPVKLLNYLAPSYVRIAQPGDSVFDGYHLDNVQSSREATPQEAVTVMSVFHNAFWNSVSEPA